MDNHHPLTPQQAKTEAERCLYCFDAPCTRACPVHIDIPTFISMVRSDNCRGAAEVVKTSNTLANICGKICPEEIYCQSVCNRAGIDAPVMIRELHFYATQQEALNGYSRVRTTPVTGKRVAVIGGGPSGIGCAFELANFGHSVTIFDGKGLGGVPKNSIPSFRLSPREVQDDLKFVSRHFSLKKRNIIVKSLSALKKKFDAVYLGVGLGQDRRLGVKGENLSGVLPVLRFLEKAKSNRRKIFTGKKVVVVGGGNVSLDAAAAAKRSGAEEVIVLYRRSEREMKVWKSELEEARRQGVQFRFLTAPVEIIGKNAVSGIVYRRMRLLKKKDGSGRPIPVEVKGSDVVVRADRVIIAIGQVIGTDVAKRFRRNVKGYIAVDKKFGTSVRGMFAGGDAIAGEGTVVQSLAHGKHAARAIHIYLSKF